MVQATEPIILSPVLGCSIEHPSGPLPGCVYPAITIVSLRVTGCCVCSVTLLEGPAVCEAAQAASSYQSHSTSMQGDSVGRGGIGCAALAQ